MRDKSSIEKQKEVRRQKITFGEFVGDISAFWKGRHLTAKTEGFFSISREHVLNGISVTKTHLISKWGSTILQTMSHYDINKWILETFKRKKYASASINKMLNRVRGLRGDNALDSHLPLSKPPVHFVAIPKVSPDCNRRKIIEKWGLTTLMP